ncbi:Peroxisomal membrane protein PMP22 [Leucoagaricus sp. SymC.cos]|nr:Peroxisomal membrane protein PMP22 [Leucoagaricus sp. SymC.cos]
MSSAPVKSTTHPLLVKYITQLTTHPLRTKAITTGTFSFLQEVLGSNLAGVPPPRIAPDAPFPIAFLGHRHVNMRAVKMAIYGFFVSAPLSHVLVGQLQKAFAGRTGTAAKVGQVLANNLLVSPIQVAAYLASMAIINGAKSVDEVIKTVKAGFFSVIRISWTVSPISMFIAQKYIPVDLWVPFFNVIQFVLGTWFNMRVKQMRLAAARKAEKEKAKDSTEKKDGSSS